MWLIGVAIFQSHIPIPREPTALLHFSIYRMCIVCLCWAWRSCFIILELRAQHFLIIASPILSMKHSKNAKKPTFSTPFTRTKYRQGKGSSIISRSNLILIKSEIHLSRSHCEACMSEDRKVPRTKKGLSFATLSFSTLPAPNWKLSDDECFLLCHYVE